MKETDELFTRLDRDEDVDAIRRDIADLIAKSIEQKREAFGYWEKAQFAHAIAALAHNVQARQRDSKSWLRLSLVCIENAHAQPDARSEEYTARSRHVEALTFDQLMEDIRNLGGRA